MAQIYKDASVGNPVSVAVVKVEILQVRKARKYIVITCKNIRRSLQLEGAMSGVTTSDQAAHQTAS